MIKGIALFVPERDKAPQKCWRALSDNELWAVDPSLSGVGTGTWCRSETRHGRDAAVNEPPNSCVYNLLCGLSCVYTTNRSCVRNHRLWGFFKPWWRMRERSFSAWISSNRAAPASP